MVCIKKFLFLFSTLYFAVVAHSEMQESCDVQGTPKGRSLLHVKSSRNLPEDTLTFNLLPENLRAVGISLFGSENKVAEILSNSKVVPITYSAIVMRIAMAKDDDAALRFGAGGENGTDYGLDSILDVTDATEAAFEQRRVAGTKMLNMIDMGGNLGVTTIAVFKKYPGLVRAVIVEPVPTTHFYMQLNLWLNDVPPLQMGTPVPRSGVAAVQKAISSNPDFKLNMCIPYVGSSMNAYMITDTKPCNTADKGGKDLASEVTSMTIDNIMANFGNEDITFVKLDCETCEKDALPALEKYKSRVRRLGGEMHMMPPETYKLACAYNMGKYLTGMCEKAGICDTCRHDGVELCAICQ